MSGILLGVAFCFNLFALVVGVRFPGRVRQVAAFSWLALAAVGVAAFFTHIDGLALAACVGMMALTGGVSVRPDPTGLVRSAGFSLALMIPLSIWGDASWVHDFHSILSVGVAGAIAASVIGWTSVLHGRALALAGIGGAAGAMTIGYARGAQVGTGYHLPLSDGSSAIHWELAPMERVPEGLRILATGPAPDWMLGSMFGVVLAGVLLALFWAKPRFRSLLAVVGAALGTVVVYGLSAIRAGSSATSLGLPPVEPYVETTRQLLMSRGLGESAMAQAQFRPTTSVIVDVHAMVPDFLLWSLAIACFLLTFKTDEAKADVGSFERAAAIGWAAWFLALIFQINLFGVPGIHSASEWVLLGCVLIGSGAAMAAAHRGKIGQKARDFAPPIVVLVWVLSLAVSWVFRSPLGLSLTL